MNAPYPSPPPPSSPPARSDASLPAMRVPPQAVEVEKHVLGAMLLDPDLTAGLAAIEDALQWRQSSSYSDAILGEGFTANYGWAEIIGPNGFFPGDDFLLGLLMLGPQRHYRNHHHPAPELYWPLTAQSLWSRDGGPFAEKPQGATICHAPMTVHATRTEETPLLALWCWTRDVSTPATLIP